MKIAVVGSRSFKDSEKVSEILFPYFAYQENTMITGGAIGVDSIAEDLAKLNKIPYKVIRPDWDKHGRGAGMIRNTLIVDEADMVIAIWDGQSKGTKHSIDYAKSKGKKIDIFKLTIGK